MTKGSFSFLQEKKVGKTKFQRSVLTGMMEGLPKQMIQSNVASALKATWRKSKVLDGNPRKYKQVSNTLIRASSTTAAYQIGLIDNIDHFANNFMKNKGYTTMKHYVVAKHYAATQASRYAMGLYNIFVSCNPDHVFKMKEFVDTNSNLPKVKPDSVKQYIVDVITNVFKDCNLSEELSGRGTNSRTKK